MFRTETSFAVASGRANCRRTVPVVVNAGHGRNLPSPTAMTATNLFAFLAIRADQSFTNVGCANQLGVPDPVVLRMIGNVVADAFLLPLGQRPQGEGFTVPSRQAHW